MAELVVGGATRLDGRGPIALVRADSVAPHRSHHAAGGATTRIASLRRMGPRPPSSWFGRRQAKSLAVTEEVCRRLVAAGLDRGDLIVVVGGGAVTDLGGFVAGVFLRGVRVHYFPTTLLGAVDAAIGGKTGVNLGAKNLVGVFRHPARVVIDLDVLAALPPEALRSGAAEALKAGMVGHRWWPLERDGLGAPSRNWWSGHQVKAAVVGEDFLETGGAHPQLRPHVGSRRRGCCGTGPRRGGGYRHGGGGSRLGAGLWVCRGHRQHTAIVRLGLGQPRRSIRGSGAMGADKKRAGGDLRMVLLADIGDPQVAVVDDATVTAALTAVGIGGPIR
jgi:hypothetical protein